MSASAIAAKRLDRRSNKDLLSAPKKAAFSDASLKGGAGSPTKLGSKRLSRKSLLAASKGAASRRSGKNLVSRRSMKASAQINDSGGIPMKVGDDVYMRDEDRTSATPFIRGKVRSIDMSNQLSISTPG